VHIPVDSARDFVLGPLSVPAVSDASLAAALREYALAPASQQKKWTDASSAGLEKAKVVTGRVQLPAGDYGPVELMLGSLLV
jgi:hypothetical protein